MQKLFVEYLLPVDPKTAWDLFESEAFRDRLAARPGSRRSILSTEHEGSVEVRRMKYATASELPLVAAKALGGKHLTYEQLNRLDLDNSQLDWEVYLPGATLKDRVTVKGITRIETHPDGCRRTVDGTIEVRMRLIGGQLEKAVAGQFEKSMGRAVDVVREMIAEGVGS